jgi:dihydrofolate reductase
MQQASMAKSPCVSRCSLDDGDFCMGCARALKDIVQWTAMGEQGRLDALARARARMGWSRADGRVRAIMALGPNGEVGFKGGLPWRIPAELSWFKQATLGCVLAIGSSTWGAMGCELPGRHLAVLSKAEPKNLQGAAPGALWARDLEEVEQWAFDKGAPVCVAGGPILWTSVWDQVELAWITRVASTEGVIQADAFFNPDLSKFAQVAEGPSGEHGSWRWSASLWSRT